MENTFVITEIKMGFIFYIKWSPTNEEVKDNATHKK